MKTNNLDIGRSQIWEKRNYRESPDFNLLIEHGKEERIAANRCVICIMTEFGISNDRRMLASEFSKFIRAMQVVEIVK